MLYLVQVIFNVDGAFIMELLFVACTEGEDVIAYVE